MSCFENEEDFIGDEVMIVSMRHTYDELIALARDIRIRLGEQTYLLDRYLSSLLKAACSTVAYCASSDGFDTQCELRMVCRDIIEGRKRSEKHPFYKFAKAYIEAHPLPYQDAATKESLYVAVLAHNFLESVAKHFYEEQRRSIARAFDLSDVRKLYHEICGLLGGEEEMQKLNCLFHRRFLLITPIAGYLQGLTDDLLYELTYKDRETSKMVVQLLLDERT
jgi:hypothetical protein